MHAGLFWHARLRSRSVVSLFTLTFGFVARQHPVTLIVHFTYSDYLDLVLSHASPSQHVPHSQHVLRMAFALKEGNFDRPSCKSFSTDTLTQNTSTRRRHLSTARLKHFHHNQRRSFQDAVHRPHHRHHGLNPAVPGERPPDLHRRGRDSLQRSQCYGELSPTPEVGLPDRR